METDQATVDGYEAISHARGEAATIATLKPSALTISGHVVIHFDGRLEFLPGYNPDEAAKIFWRAMAAHVPR